MTIPAFWSCVSFLCDTISSRRREVLQETSTSRLLAASHPVSSLLNRKISDASSPNKTVHTWIHHCKVWGNGYLWVKRDANLNPLALLNLNPEITLPFLHKGKKYFYIQLPTPVVIDDADVLHICGPGFDGVKGYPMVQLMRMSLQTNKQMELFTKDYFEKATVVHGTLEFPGVLTDEQLAAMRQSIRDFKSDGGRHAFELMILQMGGKLNNSTIPNETSQLLESRNFSDVSICQMLRVSPHIIYKLDSQKLANVAQLGSEVVRYTLGPIISQIEEEINLKLFTIQEQNAGYFVRLDVDELKSNDETLSTRLMAQVNGGLMTVNEARKSLSLPPVGVAGNVLRVPINFPTPEQSGGVQAKPIPVADGDDTNQPTLPAPKDTDADDDAIEGIAGENIVNPKQVPPDYSILKPIVEDAIARVETKTAKAFENKKNLEGDALTRWANVFATEQARYVADIFKPIEMTANQLGHHLHIDKISSRYEQAIKRKASGGELQSLGEIFNETRQQNII